jgi:hypothetical protein
VGGLWRRLTSRKALKIHTAGAALSLLGTVYVPTVAQSITDQIEVVSDTVTELTNNINAFGAAMFAVIVVVVFMGIDRFRERSAAARKEAAESETRRLLAEERRNDADRQAKERAEQREITKQFNVLIRASKINTHAMTDVIKGMGDGIRAMGDEMKRIVDQIELDRNANAANIDRIIRASDARHKSFEERQTANLEALSERLANEISTTSTRNMEFIARIHRETVLEVAAMNPNDEERIAAATIAALVKHGILNPSTLLSGAGIESKKDTGPLNSTALNDINVTAENVTITKSEPKGNNDAQVAELPPSHPNRPAVSDGGLRAGADTGADASGNAK